MVKFKNLTLITTARALAVYSSLSVLTLLSPPSHALGRLFFTPEQRQNLDQSRQQPRAQKASPVISPVESFSVTGMVKRDDGSTTLWLSKTPATSSADPTTESASEQVLLKPALPRNPSLKSPLRRNDEDQSDSSTLKLPAR